MLSPRPELQGNPRPCCSSPGEPGCGALQRRIDESRGELLGVVDVNDVSAVGDTLSLLLVRGAHWAGTTKCSMGSISRRLLSVVVAVVRAVPSMSWVTARTTMSTRSFSRLDGRSPYRCIVAQTLSAI